MSTIAKAISAFLVSLVALLAAFGVDATGIATPTVLEAVASVIGALITGFTTWAVPNTSKPEA